MSIYENIQIIDLYFLILKFIPNYKNYDTIIVLIIL